MSVEYKVKFTISGEALFALFAKMLPLENLSVEEVLSGVEATPRLAPTMKKRARRRSTGPNLKEGINGILVTTLKDKPLRAVELQPMIKAAGFSANSVNSRLEELRKQGVVERVGDGTWKLNAP